MDYIKDIITNFTNFFQSDFDIIVNGVIYKHGKFINISEKEFCLKLTYKDLKRDKNKILDIPYPYDFYIDKNNFIFDYKLDTLCNNNYELLLNIKKTDTNDHHLFYNKEVIINFHI